MPFFLSILCFMWKDSNNFGTLMQFFQVSFICSVEVMKVLRSHGFSLCLMNVKKLAFLRYQMTLVISVPGNSWGYLFLLYIYVQVSRLVVVGVLYPFLQYFGYGLDWKEATILVWSGLRGAVALSLALSVKASNHGLGSPQVDEIIHFSMECGCFKWLHFSFIHIDFTSTSYLCHAMKLFNWAYVFWSHFLLCG